MREAFQFIKYNAETTAQQIADRAKSGSVICFDLEDSIQKPLDPQSNAIFKEQHRQYVIDLKDELTHRNWDIKTGIRINPFGTADFEKDL